MTSETMRKVFDLKPFVPARDYELSRAFYRELGFQENWANNEVCEMELDGCRFLLQNFYVADLAANFMLSLEVADLDEWWDMISRIDLQARYDLHVVRAPALQPWGLRVLYLSDPSGVLWHLTEHPQSAEKS